MATPNYYNLPEIPADATPEEALALIDANMPPGVRGMSEDHARELFVHLNARIADGEEAAEERKALIGILDDHGWSQTEIAKVAEISQQAISKSLKKPTAPNLEGTDAPWVIGRLFGIAGHLVWNRAPGVKVQCENLVYKMMGGRYPVTPFSVAQLRRFLEKDLSQRWVGPSCREAYEEVADLLGEVELPAVLSLAPKVWGRLILAEAKQKVALRTK